MAVKSYEDPFLPVWGEAGLHPSFDGGAIDTVDAVLASGVETHLAVTFDGTSASRKYSGKSKEMAFWSNVRMVREKRKKIGSHAGKTHCFFLKEFQFFSHFYSTGKRARMEEEENPF